MPLSKSDKTALGVGAVAAVAIGAASAYLLTKKNSAGFTISVTPTSLPETGGDITISGSTSLPPNTTLYIWVNNTNVGTISVAADGTFLYTYTVAPNTTVATVNYSIDLSTDESNLTRSNTVTITVAGTTETMSISLSTTSIPASGGSVTVSGTTNAPVGTSIHVLANTIVQSTTVGSGGTFSSIFTIPANTTTSTITWAFAAQDMVTLFSTNVISATQAASTVTITISASSTSLPASGGTISLTGTSNYGSGHTMYLFYNGSYTQATTTTSSSGGFSFSFLITANSTTSTITDTLFVSDNSSGT